jgi:hypothetical protein
MTCEHKSPDGKTYRNIFCPDCGKRIEPPYPTQPFKLKPHQR